MPIDPNYPEFRRRRFRPIPVRMLVPNFITLLAICAGLTAIRLSTEGRMELAVAAIVFAVVTSAVIGFQLALALGAPWGTYAMGGRFPGVLPALMRSWPPCRPCCWS